MNLDLKEKNALVCGGSKGLGRASAIELAKLGANITLFARNESKLQETISLLDQSCGQTHKYYVVDFEEVIDLIQIIHEVIGLHPIHILINNSGGPAPGQIIDAAPADFIEAFNNHIIISHMLVQTCEEGMKDAGYGRIINIISTSVRQPIDNLGVSNTIRGAMGAWSKTMSNELAAFGITVNNVLPGPTNTDRLNEIIENTADSKKIPIEDVASNWKARTRMNRFGKPEEIGAAVAFLASPAASFITGVSLPVDGGSIKSI